MIPITEREAVDLILKKAEEGNMSDYRYDMLRFRLLLSLKAPHVWRVNVDMYPDVSVTMFSRTLKAQDDFIFAYYDVIDERRVDVTQVVGTMAVKLREMTGDVVCFADLPNEDIPAFLAVVNESFQTRQNPPFQFATFVLNQSHIESSPLPDCYHLKPLDPTAAYIDRFNAQQGFLPGKDVKHMFQDSIQHLPSAGVFTRNGDELVGYIITNDYGSIGKLFVDPDHRRRNIASALITYLSNRIIEEGHLEKCLINAYVCNEKSYACFQKLGYQYIPNSERNWLIIGDEVSS